MTTLSLRAASVDTFVRMLTNLEAFLDKGLTYFAERNVPFDVLLSARLAPDMFTLVNQVQMATSFAKNAVARLVGETPPSFPDTETTLPELKARIARTLDYIQAFPERAFEGAATRLVTYGTGADTTATLPGQDYFLSFALPNFYFHVSTAYDILRHNGAPLGKLDFLYGSTS